MKRISILVLICLIFSLAGCSSTSPQNDQVDANQPNIEETNNEPNNESENETILVAAAASLKNCMDDELIPLFVEKNPNIKVDATYDSSGKLQTQIEEGADVDVFMSAAMKQMNALNDKGMIVNGSMVELLENKVVLVVPNDNDIAISTFEEILKAETIAIGDPESVPAGQYAKEAFENLNIWDQVSAKASLGTNVTEVLNWVAEGSSNAGVVYATDAASNDNVQVVAEAPEGSVSKVIYPIGMVNTSSKQDSAKVFMDFLQSEEAMTIFENYGFSSVK